MGVPEIDQIKQVEQEVVDLIEAARHRKELAIQEANREGAGLAHLRVSDAEKRLRGERDLAEKEVMEERTVLMQEAEDEADRMQKTAMERKNTAVIHLVRLITGEAHVLSSPNE